LGTNNDYYVQIGLARAWRLLDVIFENGFTGFEGQILYALSKRILGLEKIGRFAK